MVLLHEETTTTAAEAIEDVDVALLPTGSIEQHGPALPLGTDMLAAEAIARAVDGPGTLVLPTLPVGVSVHHRQFDGTLYVEDDVFASYVHQTLASLADHGVRKAVIVNGHGGNTEAITDAARGLRDAGLGFAAPWNWWADLEERIEEEFGTGLGHADEVETSVMLHLTELVREERLEEAEAGAADAWGKSVHGAAVGFDTADFSDSGAVGHPTDGTAEIGAELVAAATEDLEALVDWLARTDLEDLFPAPHR
jgi:creatinine amidohydrolase